MNTGTKLKTVYSCDINSANSASQLAFYVNLHRAVIGPSATLTGRWRPDIDLRRMLTGLISGPHINFSKNPEWAEWSQRARKYKLHYSEVWGDVLNLICSFLQHLVNLLCVWVVQYSLPCGNVLKKPGKRRDTLNILPSVSEKHFLSVFLFIYLSISLSLCACVRACVCAKSLCHSNSSKRLACWVKICCCFYFPLKNRLWHFMQMVLSGDNLQEMSIPIFWEKKKTKRKNHQFVVCWICPESDKYNKDRWLFQQSTATPFFEVL